MSKVLNERKTKMSSTFVKNALQYVNNTFEVSSYKVGDLRRLNEFANEWGDDRRYRIHVRAFSGNPERLDSALVTYRGVRYYAYNDKTVGEFIVELDK